MAIFTRIVNGQSIDASTFNNPMIQLETAIEGGLQTIVTGVLASDASTITISSIPATFRDLILVMRFRNVTTGLLQAAIRLNSDATAANYYTHHYLWSHSAVLTTTESLGTAQSIPISAACISNGEHANMYGVTTLELFDYQNTTVGTGVRYQGVTPSASAGVGVLTGGGGMYLLTTVISSIFIGFGGGNVKAGSMYTLYGRGAGV